MTDVVDHIQKIDSDSVNDMTFRHFKVCGNFLTWYSSLDDLSLYGAYTKRNTLIGAFVLYNIIDNNISCLYSLEVRSEYRRKGVATKMLKYASNELHNLGATTFLIQPKDNKKMLVNMYLNKGFTVASDNIKKRYKFYLNKNEYIFYKDC